MHISLNVKQIVLISGCVEAAQFIPSLTWGELGKKCKQWEKNPVKLNKNINTWSNIMHAQC